MEKNMPRNMVQLDGLENIIYFSSDSHDVGEVLCLEVERGIDFLYQVYQTPKEQYATIKTYYARRIKS
ncbi:MAG: hypothetical protein AABW41_02875 [Nanoarchaeota archaeon]